MTPVSRSGRHGNRGISAGSPLASLAHDVSPGMSALLRAAETLGLRGETARARQLLSDRAAALPIEPASDGDRVAIGELYHAISNWASEVAEGYAYLGHLLTQVTTPRARGALLFHLGRGTTEAHAVANLNRALHEFAIAGDLRGRAVTLGQLCWPTESELSPEHRLRVGHQGLALARDIGDPWATAFCAGRLAACETLLDRPGALAHWEESAQQLARSADPVTAEVSATNQYNWGLTLLAHGRYAESRRIFNEGRSLALGEGWAAKFDEACAVVAWHMGEHVEARRLAESARERTPAAAVAAIVLAALDLQTVRRPSTTLVDAAAEHLDHDLQMRWLAELVRGNIRAARREPSPMRDLLPSLHAARRMGIRMGWDDLPLALALEEPRLAGEAAATTAGLWPSYPRGVAARQAFEALLAGPGGYADLVAAAGAFERLPEPHTAGRLLHVAAQVAPTVAEGNALRRRAIALLTACGSERALAAVLRDRTLHRGGPDRLVIPASQRGTGSAGLTRREQEVAQLAAWGLTAQEIADELHISLATARNHLLRVREKFGGIPKRKLALLLASQRPPTRTG